MDSFYRKIQNSDVVICFSYYNGIKAIKNRNGETGKELNLSELLEIVIEYQPICRNQSIHKLIKSEVEKIVSRIEKMKVFF